MTWKEKLKTLTSKWHPERDELSTVATTGDYNDLINVPQGGGGGNDNIIKVIFSYEDMMNATPSDYTEATQTGNVGEFSMFSLAGTNSYMYIVGYESEDLSRAICYFNNVLQNSSNVSLIGFVEYNNHFHAFQIGNSFEISPEQKTYYIGSLGSEIEEGR